MNGGMTMNIRAAEDAKQARELIPTIVDHFMTAHPAALLRTIQAKTPEERQDAIDAVNKSLSAQMALTAIELYLINQQAADEAPRPAIMEK